jgi:hypothetical protein
MWGFPPAEGSFSEDCNLSSSSSLCSSQGSSSAASAAREAFFQPKGLVWLDSCDKHRNEEIKQAAAVAHSQQALKHFQESFLRRRADRRSGR